MSRSSQSGPRTDAPRIPMPTAVDPALNLTPSTWKVLTDSIFPSAKTAEGILLAVHYCAARNLDVIKRPVHVVPMWSKALGQEIETVWPGIAEVQTTAARTGQWAGIDSPRFGALIERTFTGKVKRNGAWQELDYVVSFPEWCEVTVYRLVGGQRCPFTEPVFWLEAYARQGGAYSELPTEMWVKRPRGQLMKCAKAASLRAAFPEEASYTAEEMEGKVIEADTSIPVAASLDPVKAAPSKTAAALPDGAAEATPQMASKAPETPADADLPAESCGIDPSLKAQIDKVITRAAQKSAWKQAEAYLQTRFNGSELNAALAALMAAKHASEQPLAA